MVGKRECHFDRLAPELIANIISLLPNAKSVSSFSQTSRWCHAIVKEHEGAIARYMAATLLVDDDPELIRLAFLACQAALVKYRDHRRARAFIKDFINPGELESQIYKYHALAFMGDLNVGIELLLDWTATYGMIWPVRLENKAFTETESSRMRRILYLTEIGIRLLCTMNTGQIVIGGLAEEFWSCFPPWDVDRAFAYIRMINLEYWDGHYWSKYAVRRGRLEIENFPWHGHEEARNKLFLLRLSSWKNQDAPNWIDAFPSVMRRWESDYLWDFFGGRNTDPPSYGLSERQWYSGLKRDEIESQPIAGYFDPGTFSMRRIFDWFFMIGDEDRRQSVINQGLVWSWNPEPQDKELMDPRNDPGAILWHVDPAEFGWKGTSSATVRYLRYY
ncbi:hypothetical protein F4806DRAFT_502796 [Annulohypoxylon nitens]|nr:hypothetical protein F4806DRAFT_502796 [Annulohypoxylon nitens]